jgi:hypothetical protein
VQALYREYKDNDKVAMYFVYGREAHPVKLPEGGQKPKSAEEPAYKRITTAKSLEERVSAATECMKGMELTIPFLIDTMDGQALKAYKCQPAGTVVIDKKGKIVFSSRGPRGTKPKEADAAIKKMLGDFRF